MKKLIMVTCVGLMAFASVAQAENKKPSVVKSEKTEVKAIVEDIDQGKREVTLRTAKGPRVVKVGEGARNFDQLRKGDEVQATIYESIAYSVVKKGEAPEAPPEDVFFRTEKGEKPGGKAVSTRQVSATVVDINPKTREMTLKGPEGNTFMVTVDERVGDLKRIKKGDEVVANYTESIAISVRKPGQ